MPRLGNGATSLMSLAAALTLAACAAAPPGADYGYGYAPRYYGDYGYGYEPGFYAPGYAGAFCCFRDEEHHDHDRDRGEDRHALPPSGAMASPAPPRTTSGSSVPRPVAAPVAHAPASAPAPRAPGGAPAGHTPAGHAEGHSGGNTGGSSGSNGTLRRE
jgi:hypothetical protein